jgi:hypothetical protein
VIIIVNIYTPNACTSNFIKQTGLPSTGRPNTIILGDFNTPLSPVDRSSRQKLNKETSK